MSNKKNAFSLFELLVALSIMALLASFVVPNVRKVQLKSDKIASEVNLRLYQSAVENYYLELNTYPVGNLDGAALYEALNSEDILNSKPQNPYTKKPYSASDTKGKIVYVSADGSVYTLSLYDETGNTVQLSLAEL